MRISISFLEKRRWYRAGSRAERSSPGKDRLTALIHLFIRELPFRKTGRPYKESGLTRRERKG
jgi:hypothetical protein